MPKAAIYCRLSIEDRGKSGDDPSASIQNQQEMLREYCARNGWEVYDIYSDDGYSGIDRSRPEFSRMLRDCEKGDIDIVLCKDQSRFSRDTAVIEEFISGRFPEWGVRFIGVADCADSDSESYSAMRLFTSAYNEMYVKDISAKIRRTLAYKREQGQFIGSFAPYGYSVDPEDKHHLVVDGEAADVVRLIFDMYVSGEGYRSIVRRLNDGHIPGPAEYKRLKGSKYVNRNADSGNSRGLWTQSTIARILANEMYTGTLVQGKSHHISYKNKKRRKVEQDEWVRIPDSHEAIIDPETWERTQQRLNSHTRVGKSSGELPPLSGKVRCGLCGRPMKRSVYYNKARTIRYYGLQCASNKTGAMNCPNRQSISGLALEKAVLRELEAVVSQYCQTGEINAADVYVRQASQLEWERSRLCRQHSAAENRLVAMYRDKLDGRLSGEDYELFRRSLRDEEQELSARMEDISRQIDDCRERVNDTAWQEELISRFTHFDCLTRTLADEFIDCIEIGQPDESGRREVHIRWKL